MLKKQLALMVAAVCLGFVATPARGTLMTFAFEGVVDSVIDWDGIVFPDLVYPGDTLSGTATIDTSLLDLVYPEYDYIGRYPEAIVTLNGTVGALPFSLAPSGGSSIEIINNARPLDWTYPGPWDEFSLGSPVEVFGYAMNFGFSLTDYSGTAFNDAMGDSLPTVMPPLEAFEPSPVVGPRPILIGFGGGPFLIDGTLNWIGTVPEPGTALLILLGVGLGVTKRR